MNKEFSIQITTKNRLSELKITLKKLEQLLDDNRVECIVVDDASNDGTTAFVKSRYPLIKLKTNKKSRGLIVNRNWMLNTTQAVYAISLDDDAHFISEHPFEIIEAHFNEHPKCALLACRIFWGKNLPINVATKEDPEIVQGFVGCAHVWNLDVWRKTTDYPEWFEFYGEEEFAAIQLFKQQFEVHYIPALFAQHRVEVKERIKKDDYYWRLRRSLRSSWYIYLLFYPVNEAVRRFIYTLWIQFKRRVFKGDLKAFIAILLAIKDTIFNFTKCINYSNRMSKEELKKFLDMTSTKIYWKP